MTHTCRGLSGDHLAIGYSMGGHTFRERLSRMECAMTRRILLGAIGILTLILASCFPNEPTRAIDIQCIDASKYKYLWQLFGNSQQKFAEFLKVSPSQLPAPEMCRAILITGRIGPPGEVDRGFDQLLNVIEMNNGWVSEIYLASPGGKAGTGMTLGQLARTFWLKTVAVGDGVFEYVPDLGALKTAPPGSDEALLRRTSELDWKAYSTATRGLSHIRLKSGQARCASACSLLFVGGVDRRGISYVHRARHPFQTQEEEFSFGLAMVLAHLQHMDAGIDMMRATRSTPTDKVSPARAPRFPSLISELLTSQCGANVDELEKQEAYVRAALAKGAAKGGNREAAQRLQNELTSVGRQHTKLELCIATIHESKRLAQFAKYCSGGSCDREAVLEEINRQLSAGRPRRMAEMGYAPAQYNLGVVYAKGRGVAQDYVEAAKWYRLAADQGHAAAQYSLGGLYATGQGVAQDYVEAAKWYRLAADQGDPDAQYRLGLMYTLGQGVPPDDVRAHMWLNLSLNLAMTDGGTTEWFEKTVGGLRDTVAQRMSSEQIAEAEKLVREWKPTKRPR
jgi:Sel1 repeat